MISTDYSAGNWLALGALAALTPISMGNVAALSVVQ
jgi:hypothetical protein